MIRKNNNKSMKPRHKRELKFMQQKAREGVYLLYCPYRFYFMFKNKRVKYTPDFYDPKENKFYELAGTKQAWHVNKDKIAEFQKVYFYIRFEVVKYFGKKYPQYKDNLVGKILNQKGISLLQFSKELGVSIHLLNNIYGGKKGTTLRCMSKIANALEISIDEMPYMKELNKLRNQILEVIPAGKNPGENRKHFNANKLSIATGVKYPTIINFLNKKKLRIEASTYEKLSNYLKNKV